jgi:hypothetical protein
MGDLRNGRDILHLERLRARRFGKHHRGVRAHEGLDALADERIVIGRLHPEPPQHAVAEHARRPIDGIRHQEVVAGLEA